MREFSVDRLAKQFEIPRRVADFDADSAYRDACPVVVLGP